MAAGCNSYPGASEPEPCEPSCCPIYAFEQEIVLNSSLDVRRVGHSVECLASETGRDLWMFGGYAGPNQLCVLRNIQKLGTSAQYDEDVRWHFSCSPSCGRSGHTSFVRNDTLYIHGGYNDDGDVFADLIRIEKDMNSHAVECAFNGVVDVERRWHCSAYLDASQYGVDKLLVHGGWNKFGALDSTLQLDFDAPSARRWHSLTMIPNNNKQYVVFGGYNGDSDHLLSDMHLLDLGAERWMNASTKGSQPVGMCRHTLTPLDGKQLLLLGGKTSSKYNNRELRILHVDDMSWTCLRESGQLFPVFRVGHKVVRIGEFGLCIIGGYVRHFVDPFYYLDIRMLKALTK